MEQIVTKPIKQKLAEDLDYIREEVICKQPNGNYMKYSRMLKAVSVDNRDKDTFIKYWNNQYRNHPKERVIINEALEVKFSTGLTSVEDMINLVKNSKDHSKEKAKLMKLLTTVVSTESTEDEDEEDD